MKKQTGKIKGPGIPDATGPFGGTELCPLSQEKIINEMIVRGPGRGLGLRPRLRRNISLGKCICPKCGTKVQHSLGIPCSKHLCPNCNIMMIRVN